MGGLEIQRQSDPHTRGGTRTIRALGNDSKAKEKLTEATTQRAGGGGLQERGHALGMGGKNQQLVSHVRTMKTTLRCSQPLGSATSTGARQLRAEHVGGNKTAFKTDVCNCFVNKAGGRGGTCEGNSGPSPLGTPGCPPTPASLNTVRLLGSWQLPKRLGEAGHFSLRTNHN